MTGFGADPSYLREVAQRITVIVQIESREALENIDAIDATDGASALLSSVRG